MSQATNITVKNAALADVLFTNVTGAAGGNPAVWYGRGLGSSPSTQPKLQMSAAQSGAKVRRSRITLAVPYVVTFEGRDKVVATDFYEIIRTTHDDIPSASRVNNAAYAANILGDTLIKTASNEGFAPN